MRESFTIPSEIFLFTIALTSSKACGCRGALKHFLWKKKKENGLNSEEKTIKQDAIFITI